MCSYSAFNPPHIYPKTASSIVTKTLVKRPDKGKLLSPLENAKKGERKHFSALTWHR